MNLAVAYIGEISDGGLLQPDYYMMDYNPHIRLLMLVIQEYHP